MERLILCIGLAQIYFYFFGERIIDGYVKGKKMMVTHTIHTNIILGGIYKKSICLCISGSNRFNINKKTKLGYKFYAKFLDFN